MRSTILATLLLAACIDDRVERVCLHSNVPKDKIENCSTATYPGLCYSFLEDLYCTQKQDQLITYDWKNLSHRQPCTTNFETITKCNKFTIEHRWSALK